MIPLVLFIKPVISSLSPFLHALAVSHSILMQAHSFIILPYSHHLSCPHSLSPCPTFSFFIDSLSLRHSINNSGAALWPVPKKVNYMFNSDDLFEPSLLKLKSVTIILHSLFWDTGQCKMYSRRESTSSFAFFTSQLRGGALHTAFHCALYSRCKPPPPTAQDAVTCTTMIQRGNQSQCASHPSMTPAWLSATKPPGWSNQRRVWLQMKIPLEIVVQAVFYLDVLLKQQRVCSSHPEYLCFSRAVGREQKIYQAAASLKHDFLSRRAEKDTQSSLISAGNLALGFTWPWVPVWLLSPPEDCFTLSFQQVSRHSHLSSLCCNKFEAFRIPLWILWERTMWI